MADPLLELLLENKEDDTQPSTAQNASDSSSLTKYLLRLLSLRPADLTTTEPQSLSQSSQTNLLSLRALSSRSHRSTTISSDQLSTLQQSIPTLERTVTDLKTIVPSLDESALNFATSYSKARNTNAGSTTTGGTGADEGLHAIDARKDSILLSRQSEKLQDILELPSLLSAAIASAASSTSTTAPITAGTASSSANYTQALDLYAHIKRLRVLYPDSKLVADVRVKADEAMKDMVANLLQGLRSQNLRLAAAIRMVGWLRRVVPELGSSTYVNAEPSIGAVTGSSHTKGLNYTHHTPEEQSEGSFGALFLLARLGTFLSMTEDALAPLRDLADQETEKRLHNAGNLNATKPQAPQLTRRVSGHAPSHAVQGQQTERYLKRYIEIFREQSFATISMYRNIFPSSNSTSPGKEKDEGDGEDPIKLPSALASYPLHLVGLLMETLETYLPNVADAAARESLLIQVLYAANSLGRLGADFSMMISLLDLPSTESAEVKEEVDGEEGGERGPAEPEWYRVIKKHRVQAARLDALAFGQENAARRMSQNVAVSS